MYKGWASIAFDSWSLTWEASTVIGLRIAKLAKMDEDARVEAQRMVTEKMEAVAALQWKAMTGGLGSSGETAARHTLAHYRKIVGRNRRRLSPKSRK
ncbi:MAG TPA: hypothetical protein VF475_16985 [Sphingobium sp.]